MKFKTGLWASALITLISIFIAVVIGFVIYWLSTPPVSAGEFMYVLILGGGSMFIPLLGFVLVYSFAHTMLPLRWQSSLVAAVALGSIMMAVTVETIMLAQFVINSIPDNHKEYHFFFICGIVAVVLHHFFQKRARKSLPSERQR